MNDKAEQAAGAETDDTRATVIPAGTAVEVVNDIKDCPTILVEGYVGISTTDHLVKVHFVEHLPVGEKLLARYVATLAMPHDQLERIAKGLQATVETIAEIRAKGQN